MRVAGTARTRARRAASLLGCAVGACCTLAAHAQGALTPLSNDPYTNLGSFHATEVEPGSFASGTTLVGAFQAGRFVEGGSSNIGWATSSASGVAGAHGFLPATTVFATPPGPYARATDPAVAFDAKAGVWLISSLALSEAQGEVRGVAVLVSRSLDGGLSWSAPLSVAGAGSGEDLDKSWITCDNSLTSRYFGNCYAQWDDHGHSNQLAMSRSSDGALTWSRSRVPASSSVIGGEPLTQPHGTVVVPIDNGAGAVVESFVSADGGASYRGPFRIGQIARHSVAGELRSSPLPSAAVNSTGQVYAAWQDCRFSPACSANDILYSSSADGRTWSAPARVPLGEASTGADHFLPALAVDPTSSGPSTSLALTYYFYPRGLCRPRTCELDVGFTRSSDAGASWSAPLQLAGPTSLRELPRTNQGYMVGDYISSSFVSLGGAETPVSVIALGLRVRRARCRLGRVSSCDVPIEAASAGAPAAGEGVQLPSPPPPEALGPPFPAPTAGSAPAGPQLLSAR